MRGRQEGQEPVGGTGGRTGGQDDSRDTKGKTEGPGNTETGTNDGDDG